ncbi:hypothetical protein [Streptomyces sp. NPDC127112]
MNMDVGRLPARPRAGHGRGMGMGAGMGTDLVTTARTGPFRP